LLPSILMLGYAFLYIPVLLLVATSFNPSRLTTVISGFSLHWYGELWRDQKLIEAAALSRGSGGLAGVGCSRACWRHGWCCRTCWWG
jgi:ABC-type spermidine/putrescine transport system permease subunit II